MKLCLVSMRSTPAPTASRSPSRTALLNRGTARALAWIVGAVLAGLGVGGGLALWQ